MALDEMDPDSFRVLGLDAARTKGATTRGWLGVVLTHDGFGGARLGSLDEVMEWAEPVDVVGIDIPIGTGPGGVRQADEEARAFVGPRRSSVFFAPAPVALEASTYAEANDALAASSLRKLSQQAWALVPRIREVAQLAARDPRVFEVHPEVSFRELAGETLSWSKRSWNGLLLRRGLLAGAGIMLPDDVPDARDAGAADVVDAAVAAWSARRILRGQARTFPDPPEQSGDRSVAIWC